MKSFSLVPKRTLDQISEKLSTSFHAWIEDWGSGEQTEVSIKAFNAFEKTQYKNDTYSKFRLENGAVYTNKKHDLDLLFKSIILNTIESGDMTGNKLIQHLISESLKDYIKRVFSCDNESLIYEEESDANSLFKKGDGNVVIVFVYGDFESVILLTQSIYENIISDKIYERQNDKFDEFEIAKLKKEIAVFVMLNKTKLNIKDLMGLSKGDFLVLDHKTNEHLNLMSKERLITKCNIGSCDNYKLISITN